MALKIEMLRCFTKVAQYGNLADAAAELGRTPSAVSMMLKQLEEHLGKSLFEADRKNKLSPVGAFVLKQAESQLHHFDYTVQSIEDFARAGVGSVRIATVPSIAGTVLPQALERFLVNHPKVQIDLHDMDSTGVLRALEQERVDIGIATAPETLKSVRRTRLYTDTFGLVCSHKHPLAQATGPLSWEGLEGETFIANELCASIQSPIFQAIHRRANLNVHNTISLLSFVKAGLGVTILPRLVVQLHPEEISFRPIDDAQVFRRIDLLYRTGNTLSPAAESLSRYIVKAANEIISHAL